NQSHHLAGRHGSPRTSSPPLFLTLFLAPNAPFPGAFYSSMGWQQYARRLGLSREYHYILYLILKRAHRCRGGPLFHNSFLCGLERRTQPLQWNTLGNECGPRRTSRDARCLQIARRQRGIDAAGRLHRNVNVLEDLLWSNALQSVGRLDEVVAFLT